jgi:hypothetical protein
MTIQTVLFRFAAHSCTVRVEVEPAPWLIPPVLEETELPAVVGVSG